MQSTPLSHSQETVLARAIDKYPRVKPLITHLLQEGGRVYLVGGAVRDLIMDNEIKDLDIEIHGIPLEQLEKVLQKHGSVSIIGKSFGVLRVHGLHIDWSLPRTDAAGRKPEVTIDPHMDIQKASARRDLTMNAMAIDMHHRLLLDPFNGQQDIKDKILRTPDPLFFAQDPLRFYRVMQFISRFAMYPDTELTNQCKTIDISTVSHERIEAECEKMLLKSVQPSLGLRWLQTIGRLEELFPELYATASVPQDPRWHPEGTVFEHTMQTVDAAARVLYDDHEKRIQLLLAALCHDLGKVVATQQTKDRITSYGHELYGVSLAKNMLMRITHNKERIRVVTTLVRHHMAPLQFIANNAQQAAYKRLAYALSPYTNIHMLADLACADKCGRNAASIQPLDGPCTQVQLFLDKAAEAQVQYDKEEPIVTGNDLLPYISSGPQMGTLLKKAYALQINKNIKDKQILINAIVEKNSL